MPRRRRALASPLHSGGRGYLGRLAPRGEALTLTAGATGGVPSALTSGALGLSARHRGRRYSNPTLVLQRGERARITLVNALAEPTIIHWHGLGVDTRNDGNGSFLVPPAGRYDYDFTVRDRAGLYWYHPHPHGRTAAQAYRGLFGMILVEDDDERALRTALDLTPGITEIPLVLQDRRPGAEYDPSPEDLVHGFLGDEIFVNGTHCPYLDVATRIYRFRILNAANARTLLLAFRTASRRSRPFHADRQRRRTADGTGPVRTGVARDAPSASTCSWTCAQPASATTCGSKPWRSIRCTRRADRRLRPIMRRWGIRCPALPCPRSPISTRRSWPEGAPRALLDLRVRSRVGYDRPDTLEVVHARPPSTRRTRTSDRSAWASPRAAGGSTTACSRWAPRRSKSRAARWRRGSSATTTRACRTRCTCTASTSKCSRAKPARTPSPRRRSTRRGALRTDMGRKDTVLVWPGESVRIAIDFAHPFPGRANVPVPLPQSRARGRRHDARCGRRMRTRPTRLVLVGGGHSHVEVLRRLRAAAGARTGGDADFAVATRCRTPACCPAWSRATTRRRSRTSTSCGWRMGGRALRRRQRRRTRPLHEDARAGRWRYEPFDILSLDIGSTPDTTRCPAPAKAPSRVRPVAPFLAAWDKLHAEAAAGRLDARIAVVGGGAGGVELLLAMQHRLHAELGDAAPRFALITDQPQLLPEHAARRARAFRPTPGRTRCRAASSTAARSPSNPVRSSPRISGASPSTASSGRPRRGRSPGPRASGLACDARGFVQVDDTLRSLSHPFVFAAGDCATQIAHPRPKSGVFAVRQGPPLAANLRRAAAQRVAADLRAAAALPRAHLHRCPACDRVARSVRLPGRLGMALEGPHRPRVCRQVRAPCHGGAERSRRRRGLEWPP